MIPDKNKIKETWDKYGVPEVKRNHMELVAKLARHLAEKLRANKQGSGVKINMELLTAAALLHDIDKKISWEKGERHPDAAVRVLKKEGMERVANLVSKHPLHMINDFVTAPKTWEEKLLFLSDKMVKQKVITVDERFALWQKENLPKDAKLVLSKSYPLVKKLEKEIFDLINKKTSEIKKLPE